MQEPQRTPEPIEESALAGRLNARPETPAGPAPLGLQRLGLDRSCDGLIYVPAGYQVERPVPLVLMLHGAGGTGLFGIQPFLNLADDASLILLAPDSRGRTWDRVLGEFGPDVQFINRALEKVLRRYAIDPTKIAVEGFSDGATYALSLGITNGDLFSHIIAFAPGFMAPNGPCGCPRIFISHGIHDQVLPINSCSRRIVPILRQAGYDLDYHEFDGPHTVPASIADEAVAWLTGTPKANIP